MDSVPTQEGSFTSSDGHEFYTKTWSPTTTLKARVVFVHGFSDHCNFYETLFNPLAEKGIKVYSFDQRGWGQSARTPAQKGRSGPTSQVLQDITSFIQTLPAAESAVPLFLAGHSMGGAEVLTYAAVGPPEVNRTIRGYLCESPYIALHPSSAPLRAVVVLGRLAAKVLPNFQMVQQLDPQLVCRDPAIVERYNADKLCHDTGTLQGLAGMLQRAADLDGGEVVVKDGAGEGGKTRVWIGHGTEDLICHYDASKKLFDRMQVEDKQLKTYPGWYHKLHTEPGEDQVQFANDFAQWIFDRAGPLESSTTATPKL